MADEEVPMEVEQPTHRTLPEEYEIIDVPPLPEAIADFDQNGPRLMITHIVNENFKSYAGKETLGPFHKSFTAIVGPNGSGKSNVIDSMLFVFGYRAKKIRSSKISILIHNSENHKNIESCNVTVHFQKIIDTGTGDDDYEVVPNSKFNVSRTAFKNNTSFYCVDGKRKVYNEVATLLRLKGIDLDHNRFLILQGEVEQIAMMKPKAQTEHDEGMLEFLEDIIGSSRYKEPIDKLSKRVEELNEMRAEKLNRVKAVEKEKDDLEGAKDEAVEFLTIENEITRKKHGLFQKYIYDGKNNLEEASKKRDNVREKRLGIDKRMTELVEQRKLKGKDLKKIYKKFEESQKKCEEKKDAFSELEQRDVKCREDLKHAKDKGKKLTKTLEAEKKKVEELKSVPEEAEKHISKLQSKLEVLEKDKKKEEDNLSKVMESLKTETQGLQEEKDKNEQQLLDLNKNVNETRSKYNVATSELDLLLTNQQNEECKLRDVEKHLENAASSMTSRQEELSDLETKQPKCQNELEKQKKELHELVAKEAKVAEEVRKLRVKVEEGRSALQGAKSRGRTLETLMGEKNADRIPGIYGRLGDLGAIDEKYDVAISTACGSLDNILVDSITTGQKCVDFLKRTNAGIATFIGLDKMQRYKNQVGQKINTPENVPRLFDLVRVQDKSILPAFYFAIGNTLVANNMDQATRIAFGKTRYRVVTLDGGLIDISGTMSGGGNRVQKGRMGSAIASEVDPNQLREMEDKLETFRTEIRQVVGNKDRIEASTRELQTHSNTMKHKIDKCKMEIQATKERQSNLKQNLKECKEKVKAAAPDEKKLKGMENNVAALKKVYDKAQAASEKVENKVKSLQEQIMDIGGAKLKVVQSRLDMVNNHIDQISGQITKAQVNVKTSQRNLKKSEDKLVSLDNEIEETRNKVKEIEEEMVGFDKEAQKVLEEYQAAQAAMKEAEREVSEIKGSGENLETEENEMQKELVEIRHLEEKHEALVKENQNKVKHWTKEMNALKLHIIDGKTPEELPTLTDEELAEVSEFGLTVLEERLARIKPNMAAIAEYRKKEETYLKRVGELDQITEIRDAQRKNFDDLRKRRLDEFMTGFSIITNKLKEMYQMITLGGDAELELVDSLDPFSEGIVFSVRPPKKSWKNISNLSGGEKTLSSLALVFALHHYKPTPLYVMDEIDAALDFKNVSIVAHYIKERTKNAQFIIISLRNNMFELADRLVGIYKTYNSTKTVAVNPKKIAMPLGEVNA